MSYMPTMQSDALLDLHNMNSFPLCCTEVHVFQYNSNNFNNNLIKIHNTKGVNNYNNLSNLLLLKYVQE